MNLVSTTGKRASLHAAPSSLATATRGRTFHRILSVLLIRPCFGATIASVLWVNLRHPTMEAGDKMKCATCGESILSRRLGCCPSFLTALPPRLSLTESESKLLDNEFDQAKRALRKALRPDHDNNGSRLLGPGPQNYINEAD